MENILRKIKLHLGVIIALIAEELMHLSFKIANVDPNSFYLQKAEEIKQSQVKRNWKNRNKFN